MREPAKYTESASVLLTAETRLRLEIIAKQRNKSLSDLLRGILDAYAADNIEEVPSRQVFTANVKFTLKEVERHIMARLDEIDARANQRAIDQINKLRDGLKWLDDHDQAQREAVARMEGLLDEFMDLWRQAQ